MYGRYAVRVELWGDEIDRMVKVDPLEGKTQGDQQAVLIHPAEHYSIPETTLEEAMDEIRDDLESRISYFERTGDMIAAQRIEERTTFDLEMMQETGYCSGIENYSVYLSDRDSGDAPYTLLDYFPDDFLTVVDESHVTLPQVRGQYAGDKSRKDSLVENGFRLPTAYDNRPLTFEEFEEKTDQTLYVSATPGDYEREASGRIVEQIVRPTHLVDPAIEVSDATGQVDDLMDRIDDRIDRDERTLVTTLTKRMAEDLTEYLEEAGVDVAYMHDETDTLERHEIIRSLRLGEIDVLVGINLLREGLDIPEVSLVAILDADQEAFCGAKRRWSRRWAGPPGTSTARSSSTPTSLERHGVRHRGNPAPPPDPTGIQRGTRPRAHDDREGDRRDQSAGSKTDTSEVSGRELEDEADAARYIDELEDQMQDAANNLEFELAADIRDRIREVREEFELEGSDEGIAPPSEEF